MTIQSLSKREKILLYSAGIVVIIYLSIQFIILPLASRYATDLQERSRLNIERTRVEADLANRSNIENAHSNAERQFEDIKSEYPLLVPNEEVDTILTNLCIMNGLSVSGFNITSSPTMRQSSTSSTGDASGDSVDSIFSVVKATMNVRGVTTNVYRLLDAVDGVQYIRIVNLRYSASSGRGQAEEEIGALRRIDVVIDFELTFVNP